MDPSPGPDPAIFVFDLQGSNQKLPIFSKFSVYYFSEVHYITSFFKDKKSEKSHKTVGIKVLFTILAFKTLPRLTVLYIPYFADAYSRTEVRPIGLHNF
jgi:hypothetical protein